MSIVWVDTETTGLDPEQHQVWEIAWAVDDGPVRSAFVPHTLDNASRDALRIGRYLDRWQDQEPASIGHSPERELADALKGNTLAGANPAFDAAFLRARWSRGEGAVYLAVTGLRMIYEPPWRYRLLDVEAYAAGVLGWETPRGLRDVRQALIERGHDIPAPDHTAAADVECARACYRALCWSSEPPTSGPTGWGRTSEQEHAR